MNSDRLFEAAIRAAKNFLWQNLSATHLTDAATVIRLRESRSFALHTIGFAA